MRAGGEGDDGLDHVVGDGGGDEPAGSAGRAAHDGPVQTELQRSSAIRLGHGGRILLAAAALGIDDEDQGEQVVQGVPDPGIGELVAGPPAVRDGDDQAAAAQARQVVGQALPGHADRVREVGRVRRAVAQEQRTRVRVASASAWPNRDKASVEVESCTL